MLLDGIFAQIHPPGDFFVGKSELEVDDDHLFAFGQVIELLDVGVRTVEPLLIQIFHKDEISTVSCKGFIGNTEPTKEELLAWDDTYPFDLERFEVLGMLTVHETIDEGTDDCEDLFRNETGLISSG